MKQTMSEQGAAFSVKKLAVVIVVSALSMILTLYFWSGEQTSRSDNNTSRIIYDRTVLGMRALVDMLVRLELPVVTSLTNSSKSVGLALIPDTLDPNEVDKVLKRYKKADAILFVLPKRKKGEYDFHDISLSIDIMSKLAPNSRVMRVSEPVKWNTNVITPSDPLIKDVQLVTGNGISRLISTDQGALLARVHSGFVNSKPAIYVLADPDLLLNHGLDDGNNAEVAVAMINSLRKKGGNIMFHIAGSGEISPPTIWREMFKFPLLALTLTITVVFLLICLQSIVRFGGVQPDRALLKPGRDTILEASTNLIMQEGQYFQILRAYWLQTLKLVGRRFNAPGLGDVQAIQEHLNHIEKNIDPAVKHTDIIAALQMPVRLDRHRIIKIAGMIHQWKKEMLREQN